MEDSQNIGPAIDAKDMNDEKTGKEEQVPMRDFIFKTHRDIVATKKRVSRRSKSFPQSRNHNGNMSEQYSTPTNLFKQEDWLGKIRFWIDGQKTLRHKIRTLNRKQHYKSLGKPNKVQSPLKTRGVETEKMPVISSHHHAGNEAFRNKNYARACAHYTQAINMLVKDFPGGKNPHLAKLHSNRAAACLALGRPLEAIEDCEKGIACDPSFVKCWIRISTCYCYKGEFRKARDLLEKAEDRFQSDDIALKEINAKFEDIASHEAKIYKILTGLGHSFKIRDGKVSLSREEVCNALQDLKAVAGFFPNAEVIYWAHAEALLRLMEFSEVQEVLSAMVKGVGATETYHALKGWLLAQTSFFEGNVNGTMLNLQALFQVLSTTSLNVEYKCMETPDLNEVRMLIGVLQNVERARMRGKQAMRTKNYGLALEAYTSALRPGLLSPILASILYCNRAASYHGLSKYILALADCFMSKALWLDNEKVGTLINYVFYIISSKFTL